MGPISQGAVDSLAALAGIVKVIQGGGAELFEDLKAQMDAIVAKGAEVSEREAGLAARETAVAEAEVLWGVRMDNVASKNSDAEKHLKSATLRLDAVTERETALAAAIVEFDAKAAAASQEISDREKAVAVREAAAVADYEAAAAARGEYEFKLAQLKSIAG